MKYLVALLVLFALLFSVNGQVANWANMNQTTGQNNQNNTNEVSFYFGAFVDKNCSGLIFQIEGPRRACIQAGVFSKYILYNGMVPNNNNDNNNHHDLNITIHESMEIFIFSEHTCNNGNIPVQQKALLFPENVCTPCENCFEGQRTFYIMTSQVKNAGSLIVFNIVLMGLLLLYTLLY